MSEDKKPSGEMYGTASYVQEKKQQLLQALYDFQCACNKAGYVEQGEQASQAYAKVCELNLTRMVESF